MADLSQMSDAELLAIYNAPQAPASPAADLSSMSNDELLAIYNAQKPKETGISATVADVAKSGGSGAVRGATGLAGLPALARDWVADPIAALPGRIYNYATTGKFEDTDTMKRGRALEKEADRPFAVPTTDEINKAIDAATGAPITSYKPQTVLGEYARTTGEFLPGLMTPGGAAAKVIGGVMVPALLSETAGQVTKGTAAEPYARAAGAVVGGVGGAMAFRPKTAEAALTPALSGVPKETMDDALTLIRDADARGLKLTLPEAINTVSNGASSRLSAVQRYLEGSEGGSKVLGPYMADRPRQVARATAQALDDVAPRPDPNRLGENVRQSARAAVAETPEGQAYADQLFRVGPRTTAEDAGTVIQPQLREVYDKREGMRAALADQDYGAARNAPANIPLDGGFGFRDVRQHFDGPDIPINLDPAANASARAQMLRDRNPVERMPVVGLEPTRYGQVDANFVASTLDEMISTAKGTPQRALTAARRALETPDGAIDVTVGGLHNSRLAITDLISEAKRSGANNTVRELEGALQTLDQALEQVPAYGQAKRNFSAASEPLRPFNENRPVGQAIARDQFADEFVMPADRVPDAILKGGPSAARDFVEVAPNQSREAFENYLTTQVLDASRSSGAELSADAIRKALVQNEDVLRQFPVVRERLEGVAIARDGLDRVYKSPIGQLANKDTTTKSAIDALFPASPVPGTANEIAETLGALARKNPMAARELVRVHLESTFNQAARNNMGGPNPGMGAKFAVAVRGGPQQAENLNAALTATLGPDGAQGFNRYLDIVEATGRRLGQGSPTASNTEIGRELTQGGAVRETINLASGGLVGLPRAIRERYQMWQLGKNTEDIAKIIINPTADKTLKLLATANERQAEVLAARLTQMAINARTAGEKK